MNLFGKPNKDTQRSAESTVMKKKDQAKDEPVEAQAAPAPAAAADSTPFVLTLAGRLEISNVTRLHDVMEQGLTSGKPVHVCSQGLGH